MSARPFLRSLAAGAGAALVVLLLLAAWRHWQPAPAAPSAARPGLDAPYVASVETVVERMLALAEVGPSDHVVDLGCGDGRIPIAAARGRGATGYGVDIDPARIREAKANALAAGVERRVRFEVGDLFEAPIGEASVVAVYLLPELNLRLRPRLLAELRPGTRIVSHAFDMGDWRPDRTVHADGVPIHLWIVPARVDGRWTLTDDQGRRATIRLDQRYQQVSGNVQDPRLVGDRLRFAATVGARTLVFEGKVAGTRIEPLDGAARWTMERAR
ncbi:MAG TPA: methyltransferase domain-containing protein [Allosphingosinicella sp.]|jgi:SAM-dependent methyltransferase